MRPQWRSSYWAEVFVRYSGIFHGSCSLGKGKWLDSSCATTSHIAALFFFSPCHRIFINPPDTPQSLHGVYAQSTFSTEHYVLNFANARGQHWRRQCPLVVSTTTASISPARMHRSCPGFLHWSQTIAISTYAPTGSMASWVSLWKRASFGSGEVVRMEPIRRSCFARESGYGQDVSRVSGGILRGGANIADSEKYWFPRSVASAIGRGRKILPLGARTAASFPSKSRQSWTRWELF